MVAITDLELPTLDITDPTFGDDPYAHFERIRGAHWLAQAPTGFVVTGFEEMRDLLGRDKDLNTPNNMITQLMGAEGTPWGEWNDNFLLAKTGDAHKRIRGLVASTFTPRTANTQRPIVQEEIHKLLDQWVPKGEFDFAEFVSFFPITIMCRLIGAPTEPIPRIKHALEVQGSSFSLNPDILPDLNESIEFMWDYTTDLVAARRAKGPENPDDRDLLDDLLDSTDREDGLSESELNYLIMLLFGGGYDTSKNLLTVIMNLMIENPDMWRKVATEEGYAKLIIEETLRYTNVVTTYRMVSQEFEYKDVVFPAGTPLIFPIPFSGRDQSVFASPDTFDPTRKAEQRHFAFGRGMHLCLGQFLARMQIEEALPILAQRLQNPRLVGDIEWRTFPGIWGIKTLPIAFDT